jgi:hypothetical protein
MSANIHSKLREIKDSLSDEANLQSALDALVSLGYNPGIYRRGNLWRANVNVGIGRYHDGRTVRTALRGVIQSELVYRRTYEPWR